MDAIVAYENPDVVTTQSGSKTVQRFTFIDTEQIPLCVTLWGEMVETQGPILLDAAKSLSIVVAKRLSLSTYKGTCLSTKNCSSFTVDPPIELAGTLKKWIRTRTESDLEELLVDKSLKISTELVLQGDLKVLSLGELKQVSTAGEYWVKGHLQISDEYQKLFYFECSNCRSKISANEENTEYNCLDCQETVTAKARSYVLISIYDQSNENKIIAFDDVAECILQTTATQLAKLYSMGQQYDLASIKTEFEGRLFQVLVRRTFAGTDDTQKIMILVAYYEDGDCNEIDTSNSQDKDNMTGSPTRGKSIDTSQSSLSPLKRQMREINIGGGSPKKRLFKINPSIATVSESSVDETDTTSPSAS